MWTRSVLHWDVTGKFLVTLLVISALLVAAVFLAEQSTHWFHSGGGGDDDTALSGAPKEDDVQRESARVGGGQADGDVLVLKKLSKVYRRDAPPAVDGVSFGVAAGECFGLLGLNGAGKTSIFKMLTGDTSVSGGDAFVGGTSVRADMDGVRKLVGYCPQFDALIPLLTVREHLDLYCSLRGMPASQRPAVSASPAVTKTLPSRHGDGNWSKFLPHSCQLDVTLTLLTFTLSGCCRPSIEP